MIECVVNVSEGRDAVVLGQLAEAVRSCLLDVHSDVDHHRSVFTLAGTDGQSAAWRDLPVRRLALHIENSVLRVAQLVAFEANDERLWVRVTATVQDFLASLWRQGALLGTTPEEAFFVRCDRSTMSAADRHAGRLRLLIGLAPRQPAEFVQLRLTLQTAAS